MCMDRNPTVLIDDPDFHRSSGQVELDFMLDSAGEFEGEVISMQSSGALG